MKKIFISAALVASAAAFAQTTGKVGINADTPQATLDIKPNTANAATSATTVEGVLVPRVSRLRAANMGASVPESTLIYVNGVADGAASGTTINVDATGFYYFKGGVWVKMGSAATPEGSFTRNIRIDGGTSINISATDYFVHLTGTGGAINVPTAASSTGRVLCFFNGGSDAYATTALGNAGNVQPNYGACIISNGTNWITQSSF